MPTNFVPPELWPEYVHIAMPRTVCAREEVGGKQTGGPMGIRWSIWPLTVEEYITDSEPAIDNSGTLARNRAVMWKRLHDGPVPKGWSKLSNLPWRVDGFVELMPDTDYKAGWHKQARRDLRLWEEKFLNHGYTIEPVSFDEYERTYKTSTVAKKIGLDALEVVERKHDEDIYRDNTNIFGVRNTVSRELVAGIIILYSPTHNSSKYECPFILPEAKKIYAMTALINHWFTESLKRGIMLLVFSAFWNKGEPKSWKAFSLFKSHFGPQLVAYPPTLWKLVRGKLY